MKAASEGIYIHTRVRFFTLSDIYIFICICLDVEGSNRIAFYVFKGDSYRISSCESVSCASLLGDRGRALWSYGRFWVWCASG